MAGCTYPVVVHGNEVSPAIGGRTVASIQHALKRPGIVLAGSEEVWNGREVVHQNERS